MSTTQSRRHTALIGGAALAVVLGGALAPARAMASTSPDHDGRTTIRGSLAPDVSKKADVGPASTKQVRKVQLWLTPQTADAQSFANAVSTPGSASYHHYLTPAAYTARFGASATAATAVSSWMSKNGFSHVHVDGQRNFVSGTGATGTVNAAFGVHLRRYRVASPSGRTTITSNDRAVTLPTSIAHYVLGVTGLDSAKPQTFHTAAKASVTAATKKKRKRVKCSWYYGEYKKSGLPSYHGATTFPTAMCGYRGKALRAAYGMTSAATGVGQTVAYIEIGTPYKMADTLAEWAKIGGLPTPKKSNYSQLVIGQGNECGNEFDVEEQLDIEAGYAMAPGQHQLLVGGDSCDEQLEGVQPLFDADLAVVDGGGNAPLATIASNSWGLFGENAPSVYANVMHAILLRSAAEGVGMYFASGDNPGVAIPADDPDVTAVGGTSLGLDQNHARIFETGWSNEFLEDWGNRYYSDGIGRSAAGGGTTLSWTEPSYQQGVVPSSMTTAPSGNVSGLRAEPDLSAVADAFTGIRQGDMYKTRHGDKFVQFADGGTSLATPLVAGMVAAAQQGQAAPFGFANPLFYSLAGTAAFHDALPITSASPSSEQAVFCPETNELCGIDSLQTFDSEDKQYTDQVTAPGYDTMSGIGTPAGTAFIDGLRGAN